MAETAVGRGVRRRAVLAGGTALAAGCLVGSGRAQALCLRISGLPSVQAIMADRAADAVGVNTHVNYSGTIYDTAFASIIRPRLIELGVRHIRDNPGDDRNATVKARYNELARNGIRLTLVTWNAQDYDLDYVKSLNSAGVAVVEAVEPPNERDNGWGSGWQTRMRDYMRGFYPRYKSDPATRGVVVLAPSFAKTRDSANALRSVFPDAGNYLDCGNVHDYAGCDPEGSLGGGWGLSLADALSRQRYGSNKPVWATENGYKMSGSQRGHSAVTQRAAAKYLPRQFLCHLANNAPRMFIYQLINHDEEDFGLIDRAGKPRQQFYAVKNFIGLFRDPGLPFTPGRLAYRIAGGGSSLRQALLQRRDGRFYLVLWQGVRSSKDVAVDRDAADVEPPRVPVTVTLGTKITSARIFEPSFSTAPLRSYSDGKGLAALAVQVPDHLLAIELTPNIC